MLARTGGCRLVSTEFELEVMTHAHHDAIASFVTQTKTLVKCQRERDTALAQIKAVRALLLIADHGPTCAVWGQVPALGGGPGPCDCILDALGDALNTPVEGATS